MGFFGKLFGKKGNDAAGAVGAVNNVVDQVQAAVPGTAGDATIDRVQETVTNVAEQVSTATPDQSASAPVAEQPAPPEVAQAPSTPTEGEQQPPQNPAV